MGRHVLIAPCVLLLVLISEASRAGEPPPSAGDDSPHGPPDRDKDRLPTLDEDLSLGPPATSGSNLLDRPVSRAGLSAFGAFTGGFGGELGVAGYAEVQRDDPGELSPSMRAGFELAYGHAELARADRLAGRADVSRLAFRLDACPFRSVGAVRWSGDASSVALCARGDVGTVTGTVANVPPGPTTVHNWIATGAFVQARWSSSRIFLGLELGFSVPLGPITYFFAPDAGPYRVLPAAFTFALGGGAYVL